MGKTARRRAAHRARARLPGRHSRARAQERARRRAIAILGVVVATALIVTLVATVSTPPAPPTPVPRSADPNDPQSLIAAATATPNDPDTVGALADYFDKTGQYDRALALYQQYLALRPDDARARVSLGELLLASGDTAGAQAQFAQALTLKPAAATEARARLGLGNAYAALQPPRLTDAIAEYQRASDLDPTGSIGDDARTRLAAVQQQASATAVTVIAPPAATPTRTP